MAYITLIRAVWESGKLDVLRVAGYTPGMLESVSFSPYMVPSLVSAGVVAFLAIVAFSRRDVPGATAFGLLMVNAFIWVFTYALVLGTDDLATMVFWFNIGQIGAVQSPALWLIFALSYTGHKTSVTWKTVAALYAIPLLTIVAIYTNDHHMLFRSAVEVKGVWPAATLEITPGPLFYPGIAYHYALIIGTLLILIRDAAHTRFTLQTAFIIVSLILPFISNVLTILEINPLEPYGANGVVFSISGCLVALALYRLGFFDLVPVARERVFNSLRQGVVVVDSRDRIIDFNSEFERLFDVQTGKPITSVFAEWPTWAKSGDDQTTGSLTLTPATNDAPRRFEVSLSRIGSAPRWTGYTAIVYDVTRIRAAEENARRLAEEKDLLLREVHHRVKNNMATVASLLEIERGATDDERTRAVLQEARGRLDVMVKVYDDLHRSDDFREVPAREYLAKLVTAVHGAFNSASRVKLAFEIGDETIKTALLFPISLIVNELVTNAMKHAFAEADHGTITLRLNRSAVGRHTLEFSDDGVGLPTPILDGGGNFGMTIIRGLCTQIKAELKIENTNGTTFRITFAG
ncbi:MAG: PAS domain-containing protein [Spirochaetaceae bacterium]|nr:MAG: PAS domain-containing protein [Spirochaetaceae bacterium]